MDLTMQARAIRTAKELLEFLRSADYRRGNIEQVLVILRDYNLTAEEIGATDSELRIIHRNSLVAIIADEIDELRVGNAGPCPEKLLIILARKLGVLNKLLRDDGLEEQSWSDFGTSLEELERLIAPALKRRLERISEEDKD